MLQFFGVQVLRIDPPILDAIAWDRMWVEILDLDYTPDFDAGGREGVRGLFDVSGNPYLYIIGDDGKLYSAVFFLDFRATHFEWIPDEQS